MKVLLHYRDAALPPVGVWWHEPGTTKPQAFYLDEAFYTDGARKVLCGPPDNLLSDGDWDAICEHLTESTNPFHLWVVMNATDPQDALVGQ